MIPPVYDARDLVPEQIEPPRDFTYGTCPECGEQSLSDPGTQFAYCCADGCEYHIPIPEPTAAQRKLAQAAIDRALAMISSSRCHSCKDRYTVLTVTYPVHSDYDGELLGSEHIDLCVPCYHDRHDANGVDPVRGCQPSSIEWR